MTHMLTESALIDNALAAIETVLARMDGALAASPERLAIQCCLTSASALLGVSQTLIGGAVDLPPRDKVRYWNSLVEQTKVAGRAAYRASIALTDPESRYR